MEMETRVLGKDLTVSAVGLGCMGFSHAYGAPTDEKEAIRLLRRAFDLGYTFLIPLKFMERQTILTSMRNWWAKHWPM